MAALQPMIARVAGHNVQPAYSLASLPGPAVAGIFQQLCKTPQAGASLAQTCCICAVEFAAQRNAFVQQRCCALRPLYTLSTSNDQQSTAVILKWPDPSALKKLYVLSSEPGAMDMMWESLFKEVTQEALAQGYHKLLNPSGIIIHIIIASIEEPVCVSLDWTEAVVVCADVALQKVLAILQLPIKFTLHELVGADTLILRQLFELKQKLFLFRAQVASGSVPIGI